MREHPHFRRLERNGNENESFLTSLLHAIVCDYVSLQFLQLRYSRIGGLVMGCMSQRRNITYVFIIHGFHYSLQIQAEAFHIQGHRKMEQLVVLLRKTALRCPNHRRVFLDVRPRRFL
jgi:hypothetical protein